MKPLFLVLVLLFSFSARPASAMIVFDPINLIENLMSAITEVSQLKNMVDQLSAMKSQVSSMKSLVGSGSRLGTLASANTQIGSALSEGMKISSETSSIRNSGIGNVGLGDFTSVLGAATNLGLPSGIGGSLGTAVQFGNDLKGSVNEAIQYGNQVKDLGKSFSNPKTYSSALGGLMRNVDQSARKMVLSKALDNVLIAQKRAEMAGKAVAATSGKATVEAHQATTNSLLVAQLDAQVDAASLSQSQLKQTESAFQSEQHGAHAKAIAAAASF